MDTTDSAAAAPAAAASPAAPTGGGAKSAITGQAQPSYVSPRDAAAIAWAFAMARQHDPRLQRLLLRVCRGRSRMLSPSELADLLFAAVWSGLPLNAPMIAELLKDTVDALTEKSGAHASGVGGGSATGSTTGSKGEPGTRLSNLTPQQLARLAWSLSSWGLPTYAKLHSETLSALASKKPSLAPEDVAMVATTYAAVAASGEVSQESVERARAKAEEVAAAEAAAAEVEAAKKATAVVRTPSASEQKSAAAQAEEEAAEVALAFEEDDAEEGDLLGEMEAKIAAEEAAEGAMEEGEVDEEDDGNSKAKDGGGGDGGGGGGGPPSTPPQPKTVVEIAGDKAASAVQSARKGCIDYLGRLGYELIERPRDDKGGNI